MSNASDSTSYQIKTNAPIEQLQSIVDAVRSYPVEHYRHPGLKSQGACCYVGGTDHPQGIIEVHFPLPRPTIPELIAKFHADPTRENRDALWRELHENGEKTRDYPPRAYVGGMLYIANTAGTLMIT